jgi:hypothetical protein
MKKAVIFVAFIALLLVANTHIAGAQIAIYQSNPLGLITKERIKLEYRADDRNSVLLSLTQYWGLCPGFQVFTEYRNYQQNSPKTEMFYYCKGGWGNGNEYGIAAGETGPFNYALAGGGVGLHFNLGASETFFFDMAGGLKAAIPLSAPGGSFQFFYISGPGSVVDFNFHLGVQLWSKNR